MCGFLSFLPFIFLPRPLSPPSFATFRPNHAERRRQQALDRAKGAAKQKEGDTCNVESGSDADSTCTEASAKNTILEQSAKLDDTVSLFCFWSSTEPKLTSWLFLLLFFFFFFFFFLANSDAFSSRSVEYFPLVSVASCTVCYGGKMCFLTLLTDP